jgi:hypothetical protein
MIHPVFKKDSQNRLPLKPESLHLPRSLLGVSQDAIECLNVQIIPSPFQGLRNFFQSIFITIETFLQRLFCVRKSKQFYSNDKLANTLAHFSNLRIQGKIHGIYITTNETNVEEVYRSLQTQSRLPPQVPTIHIGCAAWYNFDIIWARKSTYGLIIDFNPKNAEFIQKTIEFINFSESREVFKKTMINYLNSLKGKNRDVFFHSDQCGLPTDRIEKELFREGSWLGCEESYLYLKELISRGRLIPITEDIRNTEKISKIRAFLDKNNIVIDTLYLSNVCNFMGTSKERSSFSKSVKSLLHDNTLFIQCPKMQSRNQNTITLKQKVILGREVLSNSFPSLRLFEDI